MNIKPGMIFKRDQSNIKCLYLLLDVRKSMYDKFATYIITYFQCYTDEEFLAYIK